MKYLISLYTNVLKKIEMFIKNKFNFIYCTQGDSEGAPDRSLKSYFCQKWAVLAGQAACLNFPIFEGVFIGKTNIKFVFVNIVSSALKR